VVQWQKRLTLHWTAWFSLAESCEALVHHEGILAAVAQILQEKSH